MQSKRSVEPSAVAASELRAIPETPRTQLRLNGPLARLISKANLFAILLILIGGIYCASIIGLVIGWAPIRLGWRIRKLTQQLDAACKAQNAEQSQTLLAEIHRLIQIGGGVLMSLTVVAIIAAGVFLWQAA